MPRKVEFFFDIVSPASYLAWTQMPKLIRETGAQIDYRPFFLPGLFKVSGSISPIAVPAKGRWMFDDLSRFARRYGVPFNMNPHFPLSSVYAMRGLIAWRGRPQFQALGNGFYTAMWVEGRDINASQVVGDILAGAGVDAGEYQAAIDDPAAKQAVFDVTEEAARRGAFGAPTFFVGKEMHWGQDRLDFVREALAAAN